MNIAIATPEFFTEGNSGGYGRYVENMAKIFADHLHRVFVITISNTTEDIEWTNGITICRVRCPQNPDKKGLLKISVFYKFYKHIWWVFGRSYTIKKRLRELNCSEGIDIFQTAAIRGINVLRDNTIPTIVRIAGNPILIEYALEYSYDYKTARKKRGDLVNVLSMKMLKNADYVFSPSRFAASEISERYGVNIDIIESPFIEDTVPDNSIYSENLSGKKYYLFFATLNFLKGIRALAECLDDFLSANPDVFFVFCGEVSQVEVNKIKMSAKDYIRKECHLFADRLIFIDKIKDKAKLLGLVQNAEACVMPSRTDNLPNACIEAMSLGKIVIGTNGASYEQLIEDGYNGFLCEIDDSESLLYKMNYLAGLDSDEKNILGENARKTVQRMNPEAIYGIMENAFSIARKKLMVKKINKIET